MLLRKVHYILETNSQSTLQVFTKYVEINAQNCDVVIMGLC